MATVFKTCFEVAGFSACSVPVRILQWFHSYQGFHLPSNSESEDVYGSEIATTFLNAFLSPTAVLLNSVIIHALRKTSSFSSNLRHYS